MPISQRDLVRENIIPLLDVSPGISKHYSFGHWLLRCWNLFLADLIYQANIKL